MAGRRIEDPKVAEAINEMAMLQEQIKKVSSDLNAMKFRMGELQGQIRPLLEEIEEVNERLLVTAKYTAAIEKIGHFRTTKKYKDAFILALKKVNNPTKRILEAALEASSKTNYIDAKVSAFKTENIIKTIITKFKSLISKLTNIVKGNKKKIDAGNALLKRISEVNI